MTLTKEEQAQRKEERDRQWRNKMRRWRYAENKAAAARQKMHDERAALQKQKEERKALARKLSCTQGWYAIRSTGPKYVRFTIPNVNIDDSNNPSPLVIGDRVVKWSHEVPAGHVDVRDGMIVMSGSDGYKRSCWRYLNHNGIESIRPRKNGLRKLPGGVTPWELIPETISPAWCQRMATGQSKRTRELNVADLKATFPHEMEAALRAVPAHARRDLAEQIEVALRLIGPVPPANTFSYQSVYELTDRRELRGWLAGAQVAAKSLDKLLKVDSR